MRKNRYIAIAVLLLAATTIVAKEKRDSLSLIGSDIRLENKSVELSSTAMTVSMDLNLSALKMKSSRRIVLTPLVKGEGDNMMFMPQLVINGRRQEIEYKRKGHKRYADDAVEVRRKNKTEQTIHYTAVLPAESWMENCDIVIDEDLCGCGDLLANDKLPVWSMRSPMVCFERPQAAPKTYELKGSAYIDFPVDQITLYPDYHRNPAELQKIISTIDKVQEDKNVSIDNIEICGFASPESPYTHNEYLASHRAETLKDYVSNMMSLDAQLFSVTYVAENWEGLRQYVEDSELQHKAEILEIIDSTLEPDDKEWKIKGTYPSEYKYLLNNCYPFLRRSDYTIAYTVRPFSAEEALEIFKTDPSQLTMEELYLAAQTLEPESDEFHDIFETAVHLFPDDPTANLNMACIYIERGDYEGAEKYLAKAGDSPYVWNAQGVIACKRGDLNTARQLFAKAADAGLETGEANLELLNTKY